MQIKKNENSENSINKENIFNNIMDNLMLPKDILLGASHVHIVGKYGMYIEHYKKLVEYNEKNITILYNDGYIIIEGDRFKIEYFNGDSIKINGRIKQIEFTSSLKK